MKQVLAIVGAMIAFLGPMTSFVLIGTWAGESGNPWIWVLIPFAMGVTLAVGMRIAWVFSEDDSVDPEVIDMRTVSYSSYLRQLEEAKDYVEGKQ